MELNDFEDKEYKKYLKKCRRRRPDVREKERQWLENYKKNHPDFHERQRAADKRYYEKNRTIKIQKAKMFNSQSCKDPIALDVCRYNTLLLRIKRHPDWYEGVNPRDCIVRVPKIKGLDDKLKAEYNL